MNAGQMSVQMPVGATPPVAMQAPATAATPSAGDQETTVFAGVLRGISPHESGKPAGAPGRAKSAHADSSATAETIAAQAQPETQPDALTTLQAVLGAGVQVEPSNEKAGEDKQDVNGAQGFTDVQQPQNVVLAAAGVQIAAAQQINGRMPQAELKSADHGSERTSPAKVEAQPTAPLSSAAQPATVVTQKADIVLNVVSTSAPVAAVPEKEVDEAVEAVRQNAAKVPEAADQKAPPDPRMAVSAVQRGMPFAASAVQQANPASPVSQSASRSITDDETQGITPAGNAVIMPRMADASAQTTADVALRAARVNTGLPAVPSAASAGSAAASNTPQPDTISSEVGTVSGTEAAQKSTATDAPPPSAAPTVQAFSVTETEIPAASILPPEMSTADGASVPAEKTVAVASARPNMDAYFQTSVRPAATSVADSIAPAAQTAVPLPTVDAPTDVHPASVAAQHPAHGEVRPQNELMAAQEQPAVRMGAPEGTAKNDVVVGNAAAAVTEAESTASGEKSGQNGNGFSDQKMSGQAHLAMLHQVKFDAALPETAAPAAAVGNQSRSDQAEQIVSQVKEQLAGREIRTGAEQIVIRLSPENLGELKVNLRMEDQRLKVEIVADTPMARDALMKHCDTLKESLARQNITMETFDVSTSGNKFGAASQNQAQGDWRELARQRQYNAWASAGGYNLGDVQEIPQVPVYQASTAHSMVDVHY
jgi:flagellar hook-length control protein FliK